MISICIITKNEMSNLKRCLEELVKTNYEIIVVDTGSTDNSKIVAKKYTKYVYDFVWCDDFSAARNFSISKASNDIVLIIDSDEFLIEFDKLRLEEAFSQNPMIVGRIGIKEKFGLNGEFESVDYVNRVFSKKYYHYAGRIHEQIMPYSKANESDQGTHDNANTYKNNIEIKNTEVFQTVILPITVLHTGYGVEELREKKAKRNIELLLKELEIGADSYIFYQLGKSYYMSGEYEMACKYFSQGLEFDIDPKLEYVIDMVQTYGYSLINTKQYEAALQFENIYEEFGNTADFKFLMGLIYMNNGRFQQAVDEFYKTTDYRSSKVKGANSYLAWYNIGVIYECLGLEEEAIIHYKRCGNFEKAINRLSHMS